jgi:hypothetical protein
MAFNAPVVKGSADNVAADGMLRKVGMLFDAVTALVLFNCSCTSK